MQTGGEMLLVLLCVMGAAPGLGSFLSASRPQRLELEPYTSGQTRTRRQVFPGSGMPCLTVNFLTEMKGRFAKLVDPNDDGRATAEELKQYLFNYNPKVSDQQVTSFIKRRDLNGNGVIEFVPEYILDIATPDMTPEAAQEWFALEDSDADGYVSRGELMRIAQHLGMNPQQAHASVASYYMSMDRDGDDRLSFDEYKVLYGQ